MRKDDLFIVIALVWVIAITCFVGTVSAISWGLPNYSAVVEPNGSYIYQGQNISQGLYYDLSGVFGWSGILGHWKDSYNIGNTLPDDVINLNSMNPKWVYIDPVTWKPGKYFQLDEYNTKSSDFYHGNNYVFYVVKADVSKNTQIKPEFSNNTLIYNATAYIWDGNKSVEVTITSSVQSQSTIPPAAMHTIIIETPTEIPTKELVMVTPRTPLPIYLVILSILLGVILWRRH
jgi:hypothetical protein